MNHPWTDGQVERMNRTIKDATVKRYHYTSHKQLKQHLYNFLNAYNFAKRLKTLKSLTPYEKIIKYWKNELKRFNINPFHHKLGLNKLEVHQYAADNWRAYNPLISEQKRLRGKQNTQCVESFNSVIRRS